MVWSEQRGHITDASSQAANNKSRAGSTQRPCTSLGTLAWARLQGPGLLEPGPSSADSQRLSVAPTHICNSICCIEALRDARMFGCSTLWCRSWAAILGRNFSCRLCSFLNRLCLFQQGLWGRLFHHWTVACANKSVPRLQAKPLDHQADLGPVDVLHTNNTAQKHTTQRQTGVQAGNNDAEACDHCMCSYSDCQVVRPLLHQAAPGRQGHLKYMYLSQGQHSKIPSAALQGFLDWTPCATQAQNWPHLDSPVHQLCLACMTAALMTAAQIDPNPKPTPHGSTVQGKTDSQ